MLAEVRRLADELERDDRWRDDRFDPPTPTLNVIVRDAAPALNVTSAEAVARVLIRVSPDLPVGEFGDRLAAACDEHGVEYVAGNSREAMFRPAGAPVVQDMTSLVGGEASTVPYGTDGCCFGDVRRLVVLGPGSINQAHTSDEFISLTDLEAGAALYARCIERFANA